MVHHHHIVFLVGFHLGGGDPLLLGIVREVAAIGLNEALGLRWR